ncbi:MAG TPA: hypothetical protein VFC79_03065, partial [Tissierellaceae bacterium]|nr:hypothetical protein [Tissierellaceae bacterium]
LVNELGEEVSFDEDTDEETTTTVAYQWSVVEYTLESDGDLDEVVLKEMVEDGYADELETDDRYAAGFRLQSNTVVFLLDVDEEEVDEVFLWKDAKDFFSKATEYVVYEEDGDVTYLVIGDSDAAGDFDPEAGIVVKVRPMSGSKKEYTINIEGKEYRFDIKDEDLDISSTEEIEVGDIVEFEINEEMDEIKDLGFADEDWLEDGKITNIKTADRTFKIDAGTQTYELTRNAVIFDVDEKDVINLRDLAGMTNAEVIAYRDEGSARFISYMTVTVDPVDPDPATGWKLEYDPDVNIGMDESSIVVTPATGVTDLENKYVVIIEGFDPELVKGYDVNPTIWMAVFVDEADDSLFEHNKLYTAKLYAVADLDTVLATLNFIAKVVS